MAKSTCKSEFNPCAVFSTGALLRDRRVMPNVNFTLSSNNKDQLRDLYNYLNQKVITAINTLDSSTLGNNLITSHQVDYTPSALIPALLLKITKNIL